LIDTRQTNGKSERRKGQVQLVNVVDFYQKMKKSVERDTLKKLREISSFST
jgi:hypothetical protein